MTLGERLKKLREDKNLNQVEVAKKLNISQATYNRYERDERSPDYKTLAKIADFYGVNIDDLFGRTTSDLDEDTYLFARKYSQLPEKDKKVLKKILKGFDEWDDD